MKLEPSPSIRSPITAIVTRCLERWAAGRIRPVPVIRGRLDAVGRTCLASSTDAHSYSRLHRLRVDGGHYFLEPGDLGWLDADWLDADARRIAQLRCDDEIVMAYRQTPTGRRHVAWAAQPGVTLAHAQAPLVELRYMLGMLALALVLLAITAGAATVNTVGADWPWVSTAIEVVAGLLGIACGTVGAVLAAIGLHALWCLHREDRFSYHAALQQHLADAGQAGTGGAP